MPRGKPHSTVPLNSEPSETSPGIFPTPSLILHTAALVQTLRQVPTNTGGPTSAPFPLPSPGEVVVGVSPVPPTPGWVGPLSEITSLIPIGCRGAVAFPPLAVSHGPWDHAPLNPTHKMQNEVCQLQKKSQHVIIVVIHRVQ